MTTRSIASRQARIQRIKEELQALGDMRPGALSAQYNVCGNPTCRCKHPTGPQRHGPYCQLSYTHLGKSTTEFVRKADVAELKRQMKNYQRFKKLVDEWVDLSVTIGKLRKKLAVTP